jgi:glyceraldehyde 3-phosphate dehydrogenase
MAFRVPVPTVSCAYMSFTVKNTTTEQEVLAVLEAAATDPKVKGVLAVSHEQCVSIDFQTDPHSSIVDAPSIKVVDGKALQILSWYDNEWGYAMRVTEMVLKVGSLMA